MAKITKPDNKAKPTIEMTSQLPPDAKEKTTPLQFPVGKTQKADYKAYAASRGISMANLFIEMFDFYKEHHQ